MKLHIGCGERDFGPSWVHIDATQHSHVTCTNIVDLEFDECSVDLIYASHVLEYFDRVEAIEVLRKWKQKLKIGGLLRLAVPDFSALSTLYSSGVCTLGNILGPLYGKMPSGAETIYHKTVYDFVSIENILRNSGYSEIKRYDWLETEHAEFDDHSQAYFPHMDKKNGALISLNVECKKENK